MDHGGFQGDQGWDNQHGVLSGALVVVLEAVLDDVLEDELEPFGELDVCADAFVSRFPDRCLREEHKILRLREMVVVVDKQKLGRHLL